MGRPKKIAKMVSVREKEDRAKKRKRREGSSRDTPRQNESRTDIPESTTSHEPDLFEAAHILWQDLSVPSSFRKQKPTVVEIPSSPEIEEISEDFFEVATSQQWKIYKELEKRTIHGERGVKLEFITDLVKNVIKDLKWEKLVEPRTDMCNMSIVREFFAVLATSDDIDVITVRGKPVEFTSFKINEVFELPDYSEEEEYKAVWDLNEAGNFEKKAKEAKALLAPNFQCDLEKRFKTGKGFLSVKIMNHMISHLIQMNDKDNTCNYDEACLMLAILQRKKVNVGRIIHDRIMQFVINIDDSKLLLIYPYLISSLCFREGVTAKPGDDLRTPQEVIIGQHLKGNDEGLNLYPREDPVMEPEQNCEQSEQNIGPEQRKEQEPESNVHQEEAQKENETETAPEQTPDGFGKYAWVANLESGLKSLHGDLRTINDNVLNAFKCFGEMFKELRTDLKNHQDYLSAKYHDTENERCKFASEVDFNPKIFKPLTIDLVPEPNPSPRSNPIPPNEETNKMNTGGDGANFTNEGQNE